MAVLVDALTPGAVPANNLQLHQLIAVPPMGAEHFVFHGPGYKFAGGKVTQLLRLVQLAND